VTPQMDEPDNDINYLADCSHKQDDHNVSGKKIKRPSRRQANNYADECVFPGFAHRGPRRTQKNASRQHNGGSIHSGSTNRRKPI
jgi:hypothetical protein